MSAGTLPSGHSVLAVIRLKIDNNLDLQTGFMENFVWAV